MSIRTFFLSLVLIVATAWLGGVDKILPAPERAFLAVKNISYYFVSRWDKENKRRVVLSWWDGDKEGRHKQDFVNLLDSVDMDKIGEISLRQSARISSSQKIRSEREDEILKTGKDILKEWNAHLVILGVIKTSGQATLWFQPCKDSPSSPREETFLCGKAERYDKLKITSKDALPNLTDWIEKSSPQIKTKPEKTSGASSPVPDEDIEVIHSITFDNGDNSVFSLLHTSRGEAPDWKLVDNGALGTRHAANVIPDGNRYTDSYITLPEVYLTNMDIASYSEVDLSFYRWSTSNPRPREVHNCDSSFNVYYRMDEGSWTHRMAYCGSYPAESDDWTKSSLRFNTTGYKTISFQFVYGIQNVKPSEIAQNAKYLIDEIKIVGYKL